jgi:ABC-2 type transport system permease protein
LLHHRSLTTLQSGWGLGWLLAQPLLLVAVGALLFNRLERLALRRGSLGRY